MAFRELQLNRLSLSYSYFRLQDAPYNKLIMIFMKSSFVFVDNKFKQIQQCIQFQFFLMQLRENGIRLTFKDWTLRSHSRGCILLNVWKPRMQPLDASKTITGSNPPHALGRADLVCWQVTETNRGGGCGYNKLNYQFLVGFCEEKLFSLLEKMSLCTSVTSLSKNYSEKVLKKEDFMLYHITM